jgi:hypothetical protein
MKPLEANVDTWNGGSVAYEESVTHYRLLEEGDWNWVLPTHTDRYQTCNFVF